MVVHKVLLHDGAITYLNEANIIPSGTQFHAFDAGDVVTLKQEEKKMAESQSRYGIIDELTKKKLDADSRINSLLSANEDDAQGLKDWEDAVIVQRKQREAATEKNKIQRLREVDSLKNSKKELDAAIDAITKISREEKKGE